MKRLLFGFSLISVFSFGQIKTATTTVGSSNEMVIDVTINDFTGETTFNISGPSSKWFGAAFNTTNMQGYAIVCNNNGLNPDEYTMVGNGAPTIHSSQDLENSTNSTSGTTKTFTFTRDNATSDSEDYVFSTSLTALNIAYAIGSGPNLSYHGPNKGSSVLNFTDPCGTTIENNLGSVELCKGETTDVFGSMVGPGVYRDTVWSILGCDSVINTKSVHYFEANANSGTNGSIITHLPFHPTQWYSCDGDSIINGETGSSFTPTVAGNYAVITSKDFTVPSSCVDTSDCIMITSQDLSVQTLNGKAVKYYTVNKTIIINNRFDDVSVSNINGQSVDFNRNYDRINLSTLPVGTYFITLFSGSDKTTIKVVL